MNNSRKVKGFSGDRTINIVSKDNGRFVMFNIEGVSNSYTPFKRRVSNAWKTLWNTPRTVSCILETRDAKSLGGYLLKLK